MAYQDLKEKVASTKTEPQVREEIYRAYLSRWYPGKQAHNSFAIMSPQDGHEVARCDRRQDRDAILAMARSHDALAEALAGLVAGLSEEDQDGLTEFAPQMQTARAALKLAGRF